MFTSIIIGNLGADAEFHSENGNEFVTFKVAHTDRVTKADGSQMENTVWVSCVLNGRAEKLRQYLTKGTKVCVIGDASVRTYHSQKMQRLVAGVNLFVRQLELVGGISESIPRYLFSEDGVQHNVNKFYNVTTAKDTTLYDKSGVAYNVDVNGWVSAVKQETTETAETNADKDQVY